MVFGLSSRKDTSTHSKEEPATPRQLARKMLAMELVGSMAQDLPVPMRAMVTSILLPSMVRLSPSQFTTALEQLWRMLAAIEAQAETMANEAEHATGTTPLIDTRAATIVDNATTPYPFIDSGRHGQ